MRNDTHGCARVSAEIELPLCDCCDESEAGLYHLASTVFQLNAATKYNLHVKG
ncbi:unnamed protein product [Heterotrigona itama]|uniref:Uncharacterized protein n=1 Tax=Heterotrigona itama TaxID=395501 RepID=A0A6V7HMU8_9HYME|nr:unnamed protein product [Heterotrigona itama]